MTTVQLDEDGRKPANNIRRFCFQFKVSQTYIWFQKPLDKCKQQRKSTVAGHWAE